MSGLEVTVSNVGGIDHYETTFQPGTSVVAGVNATAKTSLLKAIAFGMGVDDVPIHSGATKAEVTLAIGDRTVTRTARRRGTGLEISGEPFLRDDELRRKFETAASLLEFNPARSAVRQGENVEPVLKDPIDFDRLERRQSELVDRRQTLQRELERSSDVDSRLAEREAELEDARERKADLKAELADLEAQHTPAEESDEEARLRDRESDLRNEIERLQEQIDTAEATVERFEERRDELSDRIESYEADLEETDIDDLRGQREAIRADLDDIETQIDLFQSALTTNRELLESEFSGALGVNHDIAGDEVICWTCGEMTPKSSIEETIEQLESLVQEAKERKRTREPELESLTDRIESVREKRSELDDLRSQYRSLEGKLTDRRQSLETKHERLSAVETDLEDVQDDLRAARAERSDAQSETIEAIEETRVEIQTLDHEIRRLEDACEDLREQRRDRERKRDELESLGSEIATLTERIEGMESDLRSAFNEAMDDLIGSLSFDKLERVWLDGTFELIVARDIDGTVHRDSVGNLAESERELVGLVLGLAGFSAYDLVDEVPVLLVDSLGALDGQRAGQLVDYFGDVPEYLIAAVHPDAAQHITDGTTTTITAPTSD